MQKIKFSQVFTLLFSAAFAILAPFCVSADENITDVRMHYGDRTLGDLDGDGYIEDNHYDHDRDTVAELNDAMECALVSPYTDMTDDGDTTDDAPTTTEGGITTDERPTTSDKPTTSNTPETTTVPRTTSAAGTTAPTTTGGMADDIMEDDGGFNWLGLIIGLVIAAAIIILIILLIPKKGSDDKRVG